MKLIKLAIFSIVTLFTLITCIGLLFPNRVTVMRSATFISPKDSVYSLLSDMSNWHEWLFDSTHKLHLLTGRSTGVGAKAQLGHNTISITKLDTAIVQSVWHSTNAKDQLCEFQITNNGRTPGTHVIWFFRQKLDWYPWARIGAVLNEKILGPSMDSSFARLQRRLQP